MGLFDRFRRNETADLQLIKSNFSSTCDRLISLILKVTDSQTQICAHEAYIFAIFMVFEAYSSKIKDKNRAKKTLDAAFGPLANAIVKVNFDLNNLSRHELSNFHDKFSDLIIKRIDEYMDAFYKDLNNPATVFSNTLGKLFDNFVEDPSADNERSNFIVSSCVEFPSMMEQLSESFR